MTLLTVIVHGSPLLAQPIRSTRDEPDEFLSYDRNDAISPTGVITPEACVYLEGPDPDSVGARGDLECESYTACE